MTDMNSVLIGEKKKKKKAGFSGHGRWPWCQQTGRGWCWKGLVVIHQRLWDGRWGTRATAPQMKGLVMIRAALAWPQSLQGLTSQALHSTVQYCGIPRDGDDRLQCPTHHRLAINAFYGTICSSKRR